MDIRNHRLSIDNYRLSTRNHSFGFRDHGLGVHNLRPGIRNHRFGIRNRHVGIDRQLGLRAGFSSRTLGRTNRTHVEDLKDLDKVLFPSRDLVLVILGEDESEDRVPFAPLGDPPLDLGQGPTSERSVSRSLGVDITVPAHAVKVPMAPRTDWLSSSDRLPFSL